MAKNKKSALPDTPSYQEDPAFRKALDDFTTYGRNFANLDFSTNPLLQETIQANPQMLQNFTDTLRLQLTPQLTDAQTQLKNELANIGALESSTASSSMSDLSNDFLNTLQVQSGDYWNTLNTNALNNRVGLAQAGMGYLGQATQIMQNNENALNQFNLQNYENQVAQQIYKDQNKAGGWAGALKGGLGGAVSGFMVGGIPGAIVGGVGGAVVGGLTPQSSGNAMLQGGIASASSNYRPNQVTPVPTYTPNSTASNNPFDLAGGIQTPYTNNMVNVY